MSSRTRGYRQLHAAVTDVLNKHDLLGVLDLGAPADEYDPEPEDFTRLIAKGEPITPEVVATVWHKWFGDASREPDKPTPGHGRPGRGPAIHSTGLRPGYRFDGATLSTTPVPPEDPALNCTHDSGILA